MTPEQQAALNALEIVLLQDGVRLLDEQHAALKAGFAQLAPEVVSGIVSAVNAKLTDGGLTGLVESKIKAIDVAAEGSMEKAAQNALDGVLGKIDEIATTEVARLSDGPGPAPAPT